MANVVGTSFECSGSTPIEELTEGTLFYWDQGDRELSFGIATGEAEMPGILFEDGCYITEGVYVTPLPSGTVVTIQAE
jgi:hypothetical protein